MDLLCELGIVSTFQYRLNVVAFLHLLALDSHFLKVNFLCQCFVGESTSVLNTEFEVRCGFFLQT